ncbi:hypothetical protein [Neorhodopirellula lusitana]|uniref:hypothetical protein n=1 Tax=Neorhodopirellula lusitana TaxID=445327 RepID=UPI0038509197
MRRRAIKDFDLQSRELSQAERAQTERTVHRRADRMRRRRMIGILSFLFVGLVIAAAPSMVSYSPLSRSILAQTLAGYGWDADADSIQVGWVTPTRVTGLRMKGRRAGSTLEVGDLRTSLTLPQLMGGEVASGNFGEIVLRDVLVTCRVDDRTTSVEEDCIDFLAPSDTPSLMRPDGVVQIQGLHVDLTDATTGATWAIDQSNASVAITPEKVESKWQGVLSQPGGGEGSVQGKLACSMQGQGMPLTVDVETDSLPLSILSLVARRFPESELPAEITGDLSGNAIVDVPMLGHASVSLRNVKLRGLAAFDPQTHARLWSNELTQLDGDGTWQAGRIVARQVKARTDFAVIALNGSFSDSISISGTDSNPLVWLDQVDATADIEVDLHRLHAALPGLLPLRQDAQLHRGVVRASIQPMESTGRNSQGRVSERRRRLIVQSDAIEATAGGKSVRIAPMDATAIVASDAFQLRAEQFEMRSPFATISGQGDLASGLADLDVNFGKLARMLGPIFEMDQQTLQGDIRANVRWDAESNGLWRLRGESDMRDLVVEISPQQRIRQDQLRSTIDIEGRWTGQGNRWSLEELTRGGMHLEGDGLRADVDLVQRVPRLSRTEMIPLKVRGQGRIETIAELARPWLPESLVDCRGGLDFTARAAVNGNGDVVLQTVDSQVSALRVPVADRDWQQELVKIHFNGKAFWPQSEVVIQSMTVTGDAISAAIQGEWINSRADVEVAWRADLNRLQTSAPKRLAQSPRVVRPVGFSSNRNTSPVSEWEVRGNLEGNTIVVGDEVNVHLDTQLSGRNIALLEVGQTTKPVWEEAAVEIDAQLQVNAMQMSVVTDSFKLSTDWCGATLAGKASYFNDIADLDLRGPARFQMDQVSKRLTDLSGTTIVAEGLHETPLEIRYAQGNRDQYAFTVKGNLGWETVDTAGMLFGPAEVPFRMTEDTVTLSPSKIPVLGVSRLTPQMIGPQIAPFESQTGFESTSGSTGQGEIYVAGDVHYRPELWIDVTPGPIARGVSLTPDMTEKWLKYLAPIASDAARVEGVFSADLEQAQVYIDDPARSQIRGRLDIQQVRMNAGPLADQVIAGARQLQALAAIGSNVSPASTGKTLITLPAQTVDFQVSRGIVDHRALMLEVDRAKVVTSGEVAFDGRLNLTAQIPLDARWLGSDLKGLAGQSMTLPIGGTLSRPRLDSAGIQKVVADFGVRAAQDAVQDAAGSFLQQQLGRGQQQLEQSFNKSFEKLRIDKLFGN